MNLINPSTISKILIQRYRKTIYLFHQLKLEQIIERSF